LKNWKGREKTGWRTVLDSAQHQADKEGEKDDDAEKEHKALSLSLSLSLSFPFLSIF
jgi:hypothetical protein